MSTTIKKTALVGDCVSLGSHAARISRRSAEFSCDACGRTAFLVAVDGLMLVCPECFARSAANSESYLEDRLRVDGGPPAWLIHERS